MESPPFPLLIPEVFPFPFPLFHLFPPPHNSTDPQENKFPKNPRFPWMLSRAAPAGDDFPILNSHISTRFREFFPWARDSGFFWDKRMGCFSSEWRHFYGMTIPALTGTSCAGGFSSCREQKSSCLSGDPLASIGFFGEAKKNNN